MAIEKIVQKFDAKNQSGESACWRSQSYETPIAALEEIRCDYR